MRVAKQERSAESDKRLWRKDKPSPHDIKQERDSGHGHVRNFGSGPDVEMQWGWNDAVEKDQIFKLRVASKCQHCGEKHYEDVLIDAEDLRRYLRWV